MIDLTTLPPGTPVWIVTIGAIATIALTFTEKATKLKGPLGALARRWNNRQVRVVKNRRDLNQEIEKLVDERVASQMKGVTQALADLEERANQLRAELESEQQARQEDRLRHREKLLLVKADRDLWAGYASEVTARWYRLRQWLAERGLSPPEPLIPFDEWKRSRARNPPTD